MPGTSEEEQNVSGDEDDKEYEVEFLLGAKLDRDPDDRNKLGWSYNIKWAGYDEDRATWTYHSNIGESLDRLVNSFWQAVGRCNETNKPRGYEIDAPAHWIAKERDYFQQLQQTKDGVTSEEVAQTGQPPAEEQALTSSAQGKKKTEKPKNKPRRSASPSHTRKRRGVAMKEPGKGRPAAKANKKKKKQVKEAGVGSGPVADSDPDEPAEQLIKPKPTKGKRTTAAASRAGYAPPSSGDEEAEGPAPKARKKPLARAVVDSPDSDDEEEVPVQQRRKREKQAKQASAPVLADEPEQESEAKLKKKRPPKKRASHLSADEDGVPPPTEMVGKPAKDVAVHLGRPLPASPKASTSSAATAAATQAPDTIRTTATARSKLSSFKVPKKSATIQPSATAAGPSQVPKKGLSSLESQPPSAAPNLNKSQSASAASGSTKRRATANTPTPVTAPLDDGAAEQQAPDSELDLQTSKEIDELFEGSSTVSKSPSPEVPLQAATGRGNAPPGSWRRPGLVKMLDVPPQDTDTTLTGGPSALSTKARILNKPFNPIAQKPSDTSIPHPKYTDMSFRKVSATPNGGVQPSVGPQSAAGQPLVDSPIADVAQLDVIMSDGEAPISATLDDAVADKPMDDLSDYEAMDEDDRAEPPPPEKPTLTVSTALPSATVSSTRSDPLAVAPSSRSPSNSLHHTPIASPPENLAGFSRPPPTGPRALREQDERPETTQPAQVSLEHHVESSDPNISPKSAQVLSDGDGRQIDDEDMPDAAPLSFDDLPEPTNLDPPAPKESTLFTGWHRPLSVQDKLVAVVRLAHERSPIFGPPFRLLPHLRSLDLVAHYSASACTKAFAPAWRAVQAGMIIPASSESEDPAGHSLFNSLAAFMADHGRIALAFVDTAEKMKHGLLFFHPSLEFLRKAFAIPSWPTSHGLIVLSVEIDNTRILPQLKPHRVNSKTIAIAKPDYVQYVVHKLGFPDSMLNYVKNKAFTVVPQESSETSSSPDVQAVINSLKFCGGTYRPASDFSGENGIVFLHNSGWSSVYDVLDLTLLRQQPDITFFAFGPCRALHHNLWQLRQVFPLGGILTVTPQAILDDPNGVRALAAHLKQLPGWQMYVIPSVIAGVQALGDMRNDTQSWALMTILLLACGGEQHVTVATSPGPFEPYDIGTGRNNSLEWATQQYDLQETDPLQLLAKCRADFSTANRPLTASEVLSGIERDMLSMQRQPRLMECYRRFVIITSPMMELKSRKDLECCSLKEFLSTIAPEVAPSTRPPFEGPSLHILEDEDPTAMDIDSSPISPPHV